MAEMIYHLKQKKKMRGNKNVSTSLIIMTLAVVS